MTRRRKQAYRSEQMAALTRQLLYAPPQKREQVVRNAERLHDQLDESKAYPIDFVVYRMTDRRIPTSDGVMLVGEAIRPDLRLLIDEVSRSIDLHEDPEDPCESIAALAQRLGVSMKTVGRWRDRGLRWRWCVSEPGGKPTLRIARSAVDDFASRADGVIQSAGRFSRMDEREKRTIIQRAQRLATATDAKPQTIFEHLARRTDRSVESLRQLIHSHDQQHPDRAVFGERVGPLTERQKRLIDRAYRRGVTVTSLCHRLKKTRSTIYRAIHETRARRVLAIELNMYTSPTFERADAQEVLLRPIRRAGQRRVLDQALLSPLPEALRVFYETPIDSDRVTKSLLVQANFYKYLARQTQQAIERGPVQATDLHRFDDVLASAKHAAGNAIAGALPIVWSVLRRQGLSEQRPGSPERLTQLDAGNAVLIELVDRFDPFRSHRFESVLTNRLMRAFANESQAAQAARSSTQVIDRLLAAGVRCES